MRLVGLVVAFVLFSGWSLTIVFSDGLAGLLSMLVRERWSVQLYVDLAIACTVAWTWLAPDAKKHGLTAWPYIIGTVVLGSVGLLAYLVRREWALRKDAPPLSALAR
jgi:hypothetical protein